MDDDVEWWERYHERSILLELLRDEQIRLTDVINGAEKRREMVGKMIDWIDVDVEDK